MIVFSNSAHPSLLRRSYKHRKARSEWLFSGKNPGRVTSAMLVVIGISVFGLTNLTIQRWLLLVTSE